MVDPVITIETKTTKTKIDQKTALKNSQFSNAHNQN